MPAHMQGVGVGFSAALRGCSRELGAQGGGSGAAGQALKLRLRGGSGGCTFARHGSPRQPGHVSARPTHAARKMTATVCQVPVGKSHGSAGPDLAPRHPLPQLRSLTDLEGLPGATTSAMPGHWPDPTHQLHAKLAQLVDHVLVCLAGSSPLRAGGMQAALQLGLLVRGMMHVCTQLQMGLVKNVLLHTWDSAQALHGLMHDPSSEHR